MLQPFRGTFDLMGKDARHHRWIMDTARFMALSYGFEEIITPLFEYTQLFARGLGDTSDVVNKEMFTFPDRHGESLCLRPEGTAGVMRAVLSHKLTQSLPLKFFYGGPMFRYERPQKGRHRQFHQIGVELMGDDSPLQDAEVIAQASSLLSYLGIQDVALNLNTLGDLESRTVYRQLLVEYFNDYRQALSEDSQRRLEGNPLRILDSKSPQDQEIVKNAPLLRDYLTPSAQEHFYQVQLGLQKLNIPYVINPYIVRGLDYYTHTTFEFVSTNLGSQGTVLAGGRYDDLSTMLGGPKIPSIGWAAGVERLCMLTNLPPKNANSIISHEKIMVILLGDEVTSQVFNISQELRNFFRANNMFIAVETCPSHSFKSALKKADKSNSRMAVIIGTNELEQSIAMIRDLETGCQENVPLEGLPSFLLGYFS